jgi:hypothetical protein
MRFINIKEAVDKSYVTDSTWIVRLKYEYPWSKKTAIMTTNVGYTYKISGIPLAVFTKWRYSNSKGEFFHSKIKNTYLVTRI